MNSPKIKTKQEIGRIVDSLRKEGKEIVTTNGVFDLLHLGHITYLQQAKKLGDVLIVGLNSDNSVKKIKGEKRPLNNEQARASCLAALECVDYVVIFGENDPRDLLSLINPDIHVKGGDYKGKEDKILEKELVETNGGKIELIDFIEGYSTTDLIKRIINVYKN